MGSGPRSTAAAGYGSDRTHVQRYPARGRYDRDSIYSVLDDSLFAHVAFVDGDQPFCIPMLHARVGDAVYIHGSTASRALRLLGQGVAACLTVTVLDGLVLARSAFEHSANYHAAVLLGSFHHIDDREERVAAFQAFTNKLIPGRWDEVRGPNRQELKAAVILSMRIREASVKCRYGPPSKEEDGDAVWAGVLPLRLSFGPPEACPDLGPAVPIPPSVRELLDNNRPQQSQPWKSA
jgi:nitroimidazol reductase NimA-like FMN-containing flavoprotein (pyridoxamine 5'-phosphate oxidase superfamily)